MKRLLLALITVSSLAGARADENSDLEFIPAAVTQKKPPPSSEAKSPSPLKVKLLLEEMLSAWHPRENNPAPPPIALPSWQSLTSIDAQADFKASDSWRFRLSDRLNFIYEDTIVFSRQENYRNDLRELYVSHDFPGGTYFLQLGRINTRNGVALGFNPTDFFKTRSAVLQASIDPATTRENRLGVFQFQTQAIFDKAAFSLIAAPALEAKAPLFRSEPTMGLRLGQTNSEARLLATASFDLLDLAPQAMFFHDSQGEHWGLNLSRGLGSSLVLYAEWAGAKTHRLPVRARQFAQDTGTLPALQISEEPRFQSDVAIGGSWTSSKKFTIHLEYHYHESGLAPDDLRSLLNSGSSNPLLTKLFWLMRQYAIDQQEPLARNQIFVRLAIPDFLLNRQELSALAFVNPDDGSTTAQLASLYLPDDAWNLGLYWTSFWGTTATERGSLPFENVFAAKVGRYF